MEEYVPSNEMIEDKEGIKVKKTCWICKYYSDSILSWCSKHEKCIGHSRLKMYFCKYFELRDEFSLEG